MAKIVGNPYENLANAIIVKACEDYRAVLKKIKHNPKNRDAIDEALSLERFFRSQWYQTLTDVDGEFLIRKLRDEIEKGEDKHDIERIFKTSIFIGCPNQLPDTRTGIIKKYAWSCSGNDLWRTYWQ